MEDELKNAKDLNSNRDNEMDALAQDLADLIPVSEQLKEENETFKAEIEQLKKQIEEGEEERISMLGYVQKME